MPGDLGPSSMGVSRAMGRPDCGTSSDCFTSDGCRGSIPGFAGAEFGLTLAASRVKRVFRKQRAPLEVDIVTKETFDRENKKQKGQYRAKRDGSRFPEVETKVVLTLLQRGD